MRILTIIGLKMPLTSCAVYGLSAAGLGPVAQLLVGLSMAILFEIGVTVQAGPKQLTKEKK